MKNKLLALCVVGLSFGLPACAVKNKPAQQVTHQTTQKFDSSNYPVNCFVNVDDQYNDYFAAKNMKNKIHHTLCKNSEYKNSDCIGDWVSIKEQDPSKQQDLFIQAFVSIYKYQSAEIHKSSVFYKDPTICIDTEKQKVTSNMPLDLIDWRLLSFNAFLDKNPILSNREQAILIKYFIDYGFYNKKNKTNFIENMFGKKRASKLKQLTPRNSSIDVIEAKVGRSEYQQIFRSMLQEKYSKSINSDKFLLKRSGKPEIKGIREPK